MDSVACWLICVALSRFRACVRTSRVTPHGVVARRRVRWAISRAAVVAFCSLAAATAFAQAEPGVPAPVPKPPIERNVPRATVHAPAPGVLPNDPTAFTTVIHTDAFEGEGKSVEDLLSETVGVQVRRFGGPGQRSEISIRGSTGSQVVLQIDGVRINDARAGAVDLSTLPVELYERIEVSRGGGAAQAGSGAIGGVVNLVTRRPGDRPRTDATLEAGSFGSYSGSLLRTERRAGTEFTLGYDGATTDGDFDFQRPVIRVAGQNFRFDPAQIERINDQSERQAGVLRVAREIGDAGLVSLTSQPVFLSRGVPGLDSGSGESGGQRARAHERRFRHLGAVSLESADVAGFATSLDLHHHFDRTRFVDPVASGLCGRIDVESQTYALGATGRVEREVGLGPTQHRMSLDADLHEDRLTATDAVNTTRLVSGVVLQDEIAVLDRRVRVAPALRFDHTDGIGAEWIPRIGAVIEPLPWLRLRGNAERSWRAPSFEELYLPDQCFLRGNPNLRPEEAMSFDAGLELAFATVGPLDDVRLGGAWFRQEIDDSIVFVLVSPFTVAARNTGAATADGFELTGSFDWLGWIGVSGNATLLDARLDGTRARLPGRARSETSLRLELGPPSRVVKLVGTVQRTGELPVSDSGGTRLPARTTFDAVLRIDAKQLPWIGPRVPAERLLVSLIGRNLTDRSVRDAQFIPQPGRTFAVRLEGTFR